MSTKSNLKNKLLAGLGLVLSVAAFSLGLYIAKNYSTGREPAAFSTNSKLDAEMQLLAQRQLLSEAKIIRQQNSYGVEFGDFSVRADDGDRVQACEVFDRIELVFAADGMAVSGELPKMTVSGPCVANANSNTLQAFIINKDHVLRTPATDQKLEQTEQNLEISFSHMSDSWPHSWVLTSIRFTNLRGRELFLSPDEVRQSRPLPLVIEW